MFEEWLHGAAKVTFWDYCFILLGWLRASTYWYLSTRYCGISILDQIVIQLDLCF